MIIGRVVSSPRSSLRRLDALRNNLRLDAVVAGGAPGDDAAGFGDLGFAVAVGGAGEEGEVDGFRRAPVETPECPGEAGTGVVDAGGLPVLAVVGAELDLTDAAGAAEGTPADLGDAVDLDRLDEVVAFAGADPAGTEDVGAGRNLEVRPPALGLVEALAVVV